MEEVELTENDILYLKKELNEYWVYSVFWVIIFIGLYYWFFYSNFYGENADSFSFLSAIFLLVALVFFSYILVMGIQRNIKLHRNLLKQKKIIGDFKVIEKEIVGKDDSDSANQYAITIFSEIENKPKHLFLSYKDYNRINIDDLVYVEYFTDSGFIKFLEFENRKLEYKRYHIYNKKW
ncbi:hypothetical protein GKZ90_0010325 [Flavobacterium sp. MC2016-06]|uniref:hypothetical protein n=1 Tax=Flavobacterium sp. MC2016-06 TaxID=2676308 RepID=UPI0012BA7656|nr:hypothetical protein [Flavobacterium sp. MC2016-06]MBU3858495.1 hypothetical protein [Flavobacterium sp. MC2016-06]